MKKGVRFALAQLRVEPCDVDLNLNKHLNFCLKAAHYGADVIVFPELSLTGYELPELRNHAIDHLSPMIKRLADISVTNQITTIVGCPLIDPNPLVKPAIGAVISHSSGKVDYYLKQHLHQGEERYCCTGHENYCLKINNLVASLAVCADFTEPEHQKEAREQMAGIYLVSALISKAGFANDSEILSRIAFQMRIPVLLSNYIGETGGWDTAGKCSVWNKEGQLVVQGSSTEEGLVFCTIEEDSITDTDFLSLLGC